MDFSLSACCFTGHRPEKLPWGRNEADPRCRALRLAMADSLAALYEAGCRRFLCGMAAGADLLFGEAVVALRDEHPDVYLHAAVPFQGQDRGWPEADRRRYRRLAEECDEVTVLHSAYTPGCMMERNRFMADRSAYLIAAYDGRPGGTKNTIEYALSQGLTVLQLPMETGRDALQ